MAATRRLIKLAIALGVAALVLVSNGAATAPAAVDVDFSIRVLGNATTIAETCDSSGTPAATCQVAAGTDFDVEVVLHALPEAIAEYEAFDAAIQYGALTGVSFDLTPWPDCVGEASFFSSGTAFLGCTVLLGPHSTYTGVLAKVRFTCSMDSSLILVHDDQSGTSLYSDSERYAEPIATESLTIDCVDPQAYPGDTDGDGCPDMREQGTNVMTGGQRNFLNPWDYFDANNDGVQRVPDITLVNANYGMDEGVSPYYTQEVDRTLLGPNDWNLGPPDGKVRVPDIVNQVRQYGHDCP